MRVEAAAPHGEMEPIEREVECGENIVLVEADEFVKDATYKVSVSKAPVLEDGSTYTAGEPFELKAPSDAAASASNTVRSLGLEWDNEREDAMVMFETVSAEKEDNRQHHSRAESAGRHECRRGRGVGNSPRSGRQVRRRPGGRAERPCHIG